ncbi:hypothetical protein AEQ67_13550 [Pseudomonas sp. RIT-PI-q]|uniref:hypothetical protein n=1 Tax=Pseudomonas sp. RIT-PI-q TaxID=1690247 RepID=UPI0006CCCE3B|nr:hypothetical protein [Pseudomonas sp. RIT-PI-q]KPG98371.1 hypothetical protein AEQ67_13550 [Pseudomonas sp. RIT-PI-q]
MILRKAIAVAAVFVALGGCASIVSDSKPEVGVYSTPTAAKYEIVNSRGMVVAQGVTPGKVLLESGRGYFKGEDYKVTFRKEGYSDSTVPLKTTVNGWYWGNILFGGLIGMLIVDPLTGAMYTLPDDVTGNPSLLVSQQAAVK